MFDFYVSYNSADSLAAEQARLIINELKSGANYVGGASNTKARLSEAEYLIVIFGSEDDFANATLAEDYNFFLDELRWKRKSKGTIIMFAPQNINFSRVPFKLKNCYYFNYGEARGLAEYIIQTEKNIKTVVSTKKSMPPKKEIKYSPHPQEVTQIQYSARAPQVQSFDGSINYDSRETEGCKDDHVYGDKARPKSYIEEELDRPTITSATSSNAAKPPKRKNASCGCVASIFAALLILSVAIILIVVFANNMNFSTNSAQIIEVTQAITAPINTAINTLATSVRLF